MIAFEFDFADLDLGAFIDFEHENDGVAGSDALVLRRDFRELAAVFAQKLFQYHFRFLDFRRVKLAFHAEADFALLEAVQNVGLGNGVNAVVANAPDLRAFLNLKEDDLPVRTFRGILDAQFHIFEELCIPKRLEIAAQRLFVIRITFAAKDASLQRVRADAAVADELDTIDGELLLARGLLLRRGVLRSRRRVIFAGLLTGD